MGLGTVLGLVGPVSVYCDWVRFTSVLLLEISVWQHFICPTAPPVKEPSSSVETGVERNKNKKQNATKRVREVGVRSPGRVIPKTLKLALRQLSRVASTLREQCWDWSARCQYTVTG